jgi:hypothetical protein
MLYAVSASVDDSIENRVARRHRTGIASLGNSLIDEFGTEFVADPPSQPALARMIGRKNDGELRRNFEIFRNHFHAAIRYVGNCTVTRQTSGAALDLRDPPAQPTFTSSPIRIHVDSPTAIGFIRRLNLAETCLN